MRMLGRRLLQTMLLALGASLLCFALIQMAPGDFLSEMRMNPQASPESLEALRSRYALDRSLAERYLLWLSAVASGSWGVSFQYGCPVSQLLWDRSRNTLLLTITATMVTWPLAIAAGVCLAGIRPRSYVRPAANLVVSGLLSIPDLVLALGLLLVAVRTGLFPAGGMLSIGFDELSPWGKFRDLAAHLTLPVLCLSASAFPSIFMHVRSAVSQVLSGRFIGAARAHGVPETRLLFRYALAAAANPLISLFGLSMGGLLSSSLVVEAVMGWPGLGRLLVEAIQARDADVVVGATVASALAAAAGTIATDFLLMFSDSRIRTASN